MVCCTKAFKGVFWCTRLWCVADILKFWCCVWEKIAKHHNFVILIFQNFKGNKNWFLTELRETTFGLSYQEVWKIKGWKKQHSTLLTVHYPFDNLSFLSIFINCCSGTFSQISEGLLLHNFRSLSTAQTKNGEVWKCPFKLLVTFVIFNN